jgi:hypothetical protein
MRPFPRVVLLVGCILFLTPTRSSAEWQFTPFLGYTFKGNTTLIDSEAAVGKSHWHFGGTATLLGDGLFGAEAYFVRTPGFFQNDESDCQLNTCIESGRTYAFMGNAVLTTPRRWNQYGLRPYLSGGIGLLHASKTDAQNILPTNLNLLGMNVGGGAVGFVSDRVGLRFDLRYLRELNAPDWATLDPVVSTGPIELRYWTISFGVVFKP